MDAAEEAKLLANFWNVLDAEIFFQNRKRRMGQAQIPPIIYHHKPPLDERPRMSAIDRLKAKALEAKNIAPDAIKQFEADLDSLIGEKADIENRRVAAVSPHKEAIAGVKGEIDGLKSAIDILSND